jgi:hypothetical protein
MTPRAADVANISSEGFPIHINWSVKTPAKPVPTPVPVTVEVNPAEPKKIMGLNLNPKPRTVPAKPIPTPVAEPVTQTVQLQVIPAVFDVVPEISREVERDSHGYHSKRGMYCSICDEYTEDVLTHCRGEYHQLNRAYTRHMWDEFGPIVPHTYCSVCKRALANDLFDRHFKLGYHLARMVDIKPPTDPVVPLPVAAALCVPSQVVSQVVSAQVVLEAEE